MTQNTSVGYIPASQTSKTTSILIYDGTPTESDLTTYDEIYTTPALCFAALPAIINHAVTITMRKADGSAYAAATLQRVVAGGSITIQGEYYYNNTVASAGSTVGKFNTQVGDTGAASGDKVLMIKYSGTVGASTPADAFIDTVASVDGTEITLTNNVSVAFDNTWKYTIVRTELAGLTSMNTGIIRVAGLYLNSSSGISALTLKNISQCQVEQTIVNTTVWIGIDAFNVSYHQSHPTGWRYVGVVNSGSATDAICLGISGGSTYVMGQECVFLNSGPWFNLYGGTITGEPGYFQMAYGFIKTGIGCSYGVINRGGGTMRLIDTLIDGESAAYKMPVALCALYGSKIIQSCTFGSNITTQKTPANWAATTDGSYIS